MTYRIKIPAQVIVFDAFDDLHAISRITEQIQRLNFSLYGNDNKPCGDFHLLCPKDYAETEFEFNSPEMGEIARCCNLFDRANPPYSH